MLSFVIDDVDAVYDDAKQRELPIVTEPRDLFYRQRQLLLTDVTGTTAAASAPAISAVPSTSRICRPRRASRPWWVRIGCLPMRATPA